MVTSITPKEGQRYGITAAFSMTDRQHRAVKQVSGQAELAIDGETILGILQDTPSQFERATYIPMGFTRVMLGETVAENESIGPLADSTLGSSSGTIIGRAMEEGNAGDTVWAYVNTMGVGGGGGGGTGLTSTQVDLKLTDQTVISNTANNTPPTDADWRGGTPGDLDLLELVKPGNRVEYWQRSATDWGVAPVRITLAGSAGEPTYTITRATVGPPTITEIAAWQNPLDGNAITYNGATLPPTTGANAVVQVNGEPYRYELTNLAPETWTPVSAPPATAAKPIATYAYPTHGLGLAATENVSEPVIVSSPSVNTAAQAATATDAIMVAFTAPSANSVGVRTWANARSCKVTLAADALGGTAETGEVIYWDFAGNTATRTVTDYAFYQVSETNKREITLLMERAPAAGGGSGTDTRYEWRVGEFHIPAGQTIPANETINTKTGHANTTKLDTATFHVVNLGAAAGFTERLGVSIRLGLDQQEITYIDNNNFSFGRTLVGPQTLRFEERTPETV